MQSRAKEPHAQPSTIVLEYQHYLRTLRNLRSHSSSSAFLRPSSHLPHLTHHLPNPHQTTPSQYRTSTLGYKQSSPWRTTKFHPQWTQRTEHSAIHGHYTKLAPSLRQNYCREGSARRVVPSHSGHHSHKGIKRWPEVVRGSQAVVRGRLLVLCTPSVVVLEGKRQILVCPHPSTVHLDPAQLPCLRVLPCTANNPWKGNQKHQKHQKQKPERYC